MKKLIIMLASFALVASFAMSAAADPDWDFYGSSRVFTTYTDTEVFAAEDVEDFTLGLQGNSRIGANVKVSDTLSGRFEYGTGVNVRLLYGVWNFGPGTLLVGQTYTPANFFYSSSIYNGDTGALPWGGIYSGRQPVLQLQFGGLKLALVSAASATLVTDSIVSDTEKDLPAVEISYDFKMDNFSAKVAAAYNTFEVESAGAWYDIDSYILGVGGKISFGNFYVAGDGYVGENTQHLIWTDFGGALAASVASGVVSDVENMGFLLVAGASLTDMFSVEFGYGYAEADKDGMTADDEVSTAYALVGINLAPGVSVTPEVGMIDYNEVGQGEVVYVAAKWMINF
jgi:hypothetical protein